MLNAASISWDMNNQCHLVAKKQLSDICMSVKHIFFFFKLHRMKLIVLVSRYWCINFYFMITILTILGFINFVNKIIDIIYRILITRRFCKFFNKIGLFESIFLCYRWDCNARNRETNKYEGLRRENRRRLRRTIKDCKQYDRTISLFVFVVAKYVNVYVAVQNAILPEENGDSSHPKIIRYFHKQESNDDLFAAF